MSKGRRQFVSPVFHFVSVFFFLMLEFNEERIEMFKKAVPHIKVINADNMSMNYASNLEIEASVS